MAALMFGHCTRPIRNWNFFPCGLTLRRGGGGRVMILGKAWEWCCPRGARFLGIFHMRQVLKPRCYNKEGRDKKGIKYRGRGRGRCCCTVSNKSSFLDQECCLAWPLETFQPGAVGNSARETVSWAICHSFHEGFFCVSSPPLYCQVVRVLWGLICAKHALPYWGMACPLHSHFGNKAR